MSSVFKLILMLAWSITEAHSSGILIERTLLKGGNEMVHGELITLSEPRGVEVVLVLMGGTNQNAEPLVRDSAWQDFARHQGWALCGLTLISPETLLENEQGYYFSNSGSHRLVHDGLAAKFGTDVRLVLYGFSGGARFVHMFVQHYPETVQVWCASSAREWKLERDRFDGFPPGVVACGELDATRFLPSRNFARNIASLGGRVTWVPIEAETHRRNAAFEKFLRDYFLAAQSATNEGMGMQIAFGSEGGASANEGEWIWLPSHELAAPLEKLKGRSE